MREFLVVDFGAVGDGVTLNTDSINNALKECARQGGGRIVFPEGVFVSGSVELYSNVELCLEKGAVLKASENPNHFQPNGFIHNEMGPTTALLWARDRKNITICGRGTIDINSPAYYGENAVKIFNGAPTDENRDCFVFEKNPHRINQPIFFESCREIAVRDVTIINSTCWTVTFSRSEDITAENVTIRNSVNVPNDDGIHFSASKNGTVKNCDIACLDDCVAITSITAKELENSNIKIENCKLSSRSAAIRIGHKVRNVEVKNITITKNNRAIGIFTAPNGYIENVDISNVRLECFCYPSVCWGNGEAVVVAAAQNESHIENIRFKNITGTAANGIIVFGSNNNVKNISFSDVNLRLTGNSDEKNLIDLRPYYTEKVSGAVDIFVRGAEQPTTNNAKVE